MPQPLELYGDRTGNCLRAAIALEEAGLDHVVRRVDLGAGAHHQEPFLTLNPLGKVPVLVDHGGDEPLVLTQSNAIMTYAAALAPGRLIPADDARAMARCDERLFFFITDMIAPSHAAFLARAYGDDLAAAHLGGRVLAMAQAAEAFLEDGDYMSGAGFGLADIAGFTIIRSLGEWDGLSRLPRLRRWMDRIAARPAVRRGLAAFDEPPPLG